MAEFASEKIEDPVKKYEGFEAPAAASAHYAVGTVHQPQRSTWSTGFCECIAHGWGPCVDATFCSYCVLSQMYNKMYNDRSHQIHWPLCGTLFLCNVLSGLEGLGGANVITNAFLFTMRRDLRHRYNIHIDHEGTEGALNEEERQREMFPMCGEFGSDLLLSLFCSGCLLCQMQREMALRGDYAGYVMVSSDAQQELSAAAQPTVQQIV